MTKQKRSTLKSYFRTGAYPTEQQFSHMLDSYVHKDDTIGMDSVEGLSEALNSKAEKAVTDLKGYAETGKVLPLNGVYVYYGMPVHSRALEALDTDFDPEAQEGDTTQVLVFCCAHMDGDNSGKGSIYLVYQSTNSGYAYYRNFHNENVPEDILRAFGEATATSTADGLMSKEDKQKLETLPSKATVVKIERYMEEGSGLPDDKGAFTYNDIPISPICVTTGNDLHQGGTFLYFPRCSSYQSLFDEEPEEKVEYIVFGRETLSPEGYAYKGIVEELPSWVTKKTTEKLPVATTSKKGLMSAPDKKKLDAIKLLDIKDYCVRKGKLPQDVGNRNFFTKDGLPVEMRQWDSNSQKYLVFATLSLGDMEEKALGTAPMEYRNSYYVFIDDDNGYYEYDREYSYGNVPIEIARAFHGEERSEAVTDIFSL